MSKREIVARVYAQRLHAAHEKRNLGRVGTPWEDLSAECQREYLQVAENVQAALEAHPGQRAAAVESLVSQYALSRYGDTARNYWRRRVAEAVDGD